jgi:hypothetical protein
MYSNSSILCKQAALRVRDFFSNGKQYLLHALFLDEKSTYHRYKKLKFPKLSPKVIGSGKESKFSLEQDKVKLSRRAAHISLETAEKQITISEYNIAAIHAHQCCVNQKHPSIALINNILARGSELNAQRVSLWKFKEYLLAAHKLKRFVLEQDVERNSPAKKHNIHFIAEEEQNDITDEKHTEMWQEYLQSQEERLFQVGRVTKNSLQ